MILVKSVPPGEVFQRGSVHLEKKAFLEKLNKFKP